MIQPRSSKRGRNAALASDGAPGHQFSGGGNFTQVKRRAFCTLAWLICALRRSKVPSNQRPNTVDKLSVVPRRASASQWRPTRIISRGNCWCGFGTSAASLVILQVDDDDQLSDPTTTEISGGSALLKVWDYCFVESLNNTVLRGCPIAW